MNKAHRAADPAACYFEAPAPSWDAGALSDQARTFSAVAYSGEAIRNHWKWGDLVIDLASLCFAEACPVLLEHDRARRVGVCALAVRDGALAATGRLLRNAKAVALAADADDGFPWQMSVHADPGRIERVEAGEVALLRAARGHGPARDIGGHRGPGPAGTPAARIPP